MRICLLLIICLISIYSCTTNAQKAANHSEIVTYDLICQPIDTIQKLFTNVKDTVFEVGNLPWPGKIVSHADGTKTLFQSAWLDHNRVWEIITTSKVISAEVPFRVGDSISKIIREGYSFTYSDNEPYFYFSGNKTKNFIIFKVQDEYLRAFYNQVAKKGKLNPMKHLNAKSLITELTISSDCWPERYEHK